MVFDKVIIQSGKKGKKINVAPLLLDPENFFGNHQVDHLVKFKDTFEKITRDYTNAKALVMVRQAQHDQAKLIFSNKKIKKNR